MPTETTDEVTFPVGAVSKLTGLSPHVLRAWERRYGVVEPLRSEGGTRRYRESDLEKLRLVKAAVDAGHRIGQVDRARQGVQSKVRDWARAGALGNLDLAASLEKLLDRFGNRIRHADYGYSGFFDAVKIWEDELDRLYEFDLALTERVEELALRIESLSSTAEEMELRDVLQATEEADKAFDERATVFESWPRWL